MRRIRVLVSIVAALTLSFALAACGGGDAPQAVAGKPGGPAGGPPGGRPETPPAPIAVAAAARGTISTYYEANATLAAEKEAQILARVSGVVVARQVEEGDWVREGQELLHIGDSEYRLRLDQSQANLANQKARFERIDKMFQEGLASAEEHETAKSDLEGATAEAGIAGLNYSYCKVEAPFSGRVVRRLVDVGQTVSSGTPLFALADFDPLLAEVHVPSKAFGSLRAEQPVTLTLDSDGTRLSGRIKLVSPTIDPTTGTIKLTIEIPSYPEGTRPGDFAMVRIVTDSRSNALLIPRIAVVTDRGEQVVYVAAGGQAERRVVELGFQDDENAEVLNGVTDGELVVVRGQRTLKHGAPVKILDGAPAGADSINAARP